MRGWRGLACDGLQLDMADLIERPYGFGGVVKLHKMTAVAIFERCHTDYAI
jgi:hypothetical protein